MTPEYARSAVFVPFLRGAELHGVMGVINQEREFAFNESDVHLLETIASSMSVALENARLFDETQQRNAELAIINSVQESLAAELDIQGIYDAVGDKICEIFDDVDVSIRIYDPATNLIHYPYHFDKGKRIQHISPDPLEIGGFGTHVIRTRETVVVNENMADAAKRYGSSVIPGERGYEKSTVFVPLVMGDQVRTDGETPREEGGLIAPLEPIQLHQAVNRLLDSLARVGNRLAVRGAEQRRPLPFQAGQGIAAQVQLFKAAVGDLRVIQRGQLAR